MSETVTYGISGYGAGGAFIDIPVPAARAKQALKIAGVRPVCSCGLLPGVCVHISHRQAQKILDIVSPGARFSEPHKWVFTSFNGTPDARQKAALESHR